MKEITFNTSNYKPLAQFFPEATLALYSNIALLFNPMAPIPQETPSGLLVPGQLGGPTIEDRLKIGGINQEKEEGEKIQSRGYIINTAPIRDEDLYQFDLAQDLNRPELSIICRVEKRDGINSQALLNKIGQFAISQNQNLGQQTQSTDQTIAEQQIPNVKQFFIPPTPAIVYGTFQYGGHLYLEVDGIQIGNNLMHHNKRRHFGFNQRL